ncbi:amidohydrolase family protein [Actinoplanes sp. NPDC049802]|uniref:amidohydrolase family protein n=1 Tax=Actinoplanes sp. NPDC049802 TaxID=3154742 RepID=UPI0033E2235B
MRIDCHQHLWPPAFVEALRWRGYLRDWTLHLPGEQPYRVDPAAHDIGRRRARELAEGAGQVLVSLSSPLGIEHGTDHDLLDVWHESALELPDPFRVWAAASVTEPDPSALTRLLREDRVAGLQLPATALGDPAAIGHVSPLLSALEQAGKPLLVHPGPAPSGDSGTPGWWPALVPYVAQLHRSWMAWHVAGRARHPYLRIGFVALAGLAPLHHERLAARGGAFAVDPGVFYETSSYRADAIEALTRVAGADSLVHGSDRPYAQPLGRAVFPDALFTTNAQRFLTGTP